MQGKNIHVSIGGDYAHVTPDGKVITLREGRHEVASVNMREFQVLLDRIEEP